MPPSSRVVSNCCRRALWVLFQPAHLRGPRPCQHASPAVCSGPRDRYRVRPRHAQGAQAETTIDSLKEQGFIRIGFANEAPFGFATPTAATGEAPEVAKAVLQRMGITEVDGVLTEFASLIPGLKAGRFDIIAAGMYVNPKRCEQIAFSEPSYGIGQAFLVMAGNPKGLRTFEDVAGKPDVKLGVMAGAIEKSYADQSGVPPIRSRPIPTGRRGVAAVKAGRIDAFALSSLSIANLVEPAGEGSGVESTPPFGTVAGKA